MATKSSPTLDPETDAKLDAWCETHGADKAKVISFAVSEWLADYDRGRWPHSHSFVEPNEAIVK